MNGTKGHEDRSAAEVGRRYWERHAKNYDRSMWFLGKPIRHVVPLVREAVEGAKEVLEVAAGTGIFTMEIASAVPRLVATDYSAGMVDVLRARVAAAGLQSVECAQADIYHLGFEPERFDVVVAANVLHLIPDLPGAIAAFRRVLRPSGRLVVPTFCHNETWLSAFVSRALALTGFPGQRRFTAVSLRKSLEAEGLRVGRQETVPGLIPVSYVEGAFQGEG